MARADAAESALAESREEATLRQQAAVEAAAHMQSLEDDVRKAQQQSERARAEAQQLRQGPHTGCFFHFLVMGVRCLTHA